MMMLGQKLGTHLSKVKLDPSFSSSTKTKKQTNKKLQRPQHKTRDSEITKRKHQITEKGKSDKHSQKPRRKQNI